MSLRSILTDVSCGTDLRRFWQLFYLRSRTPRVLTGGGA